MAQKKPKPKLVRTTVYLDAQDYKRLRLRILKDGSTFSLWLRAQINSCLTRAT